MRVIMTLDNGNEYYQEKGRYYENQNEITHDEYNEAMKIYRSEIKNEDDKKRFVYRA